LGCPARAQAQATACFIIITLVVVGDRRCCCICQSPWPISLSSMTIVDTAGTPKHTMHAAGLSTAQLAYSRDRWSPERKVRQHEPFFPCDIAALQRPPATAPLYASSSWAAPNVPAPKRPFAATSRQTNPLSPTYRLASPTPHVCSELPSMISSPASAAQLGAAALYRQMGVTNRAISSAFSTPYERRPFHCPLDTRHAEIKCSSSWQ
jgi:hypothetical protein